MLLRRIIRVRHGGGRILCDPLVGARRALHEFPLVAEQVLEVIVAPLGRRGGPDDLDPAGDRIGAFAGAETVGPTQPLLSEAGGLGLAADVVGRGGPVGLAEGVTAGNEGDRLFVVHGHAGERLADVAGRGDRVGLAVRTLGIDVNEAHLHGGERVFEFAVTGVALIAQPSGFPAPIHILLGLPHVGPTAAEAEGFEAHRLERAIAGEHEQIGPGDFLAVFLFDRPEQPAGFVEVGVVGPAVERGKTLLTRTGAAATVGGAVGAGRMPSHADEERAIVAEVGRPPVLRVGHQRVEVFLQRRQIELLELRRVIEVPAHGIGQGGILVQDFQIELIGPPVAVGEPARDRGRGFRGVAVQVRKRTFAAGAAIWIFHKGIG